MKHPINAMTLALVVAHAGCTSEPRIIAIAVDEMSAAAAAMAYEDAIAAQPRLARKVALKVLPPEAGVDPLLAIDAAERIATNPNVIAVVGHSNSASSIAVAPIYDQSQLPLIAPKTTAVLYGSGTTHAYRLVPGDDRQAAFLVNEALHVNAGMRRAAIFFMNNSYGRPLRSVVHRELGRRGVAATYEAIISDDTIALKRSARIAFASEPDAIFWLGWNEHGSELRIIYDVMSEVGRPLPVFGADAAGGPGLQSDPERFTGLRYVRIFDNWRTDPSESAYASRYQRRTGSLPSERAAAVYDAVTVLMRAVSANGATREGVQTHLQSFGKSVKPFEGWTGVVTFDGARSTPRAYSFAEVTKPGVANAVSR